MNGSIVWRNIKRQLLSFLILTVVTPAAIAHEFWIEPEQYRIDPLSLMKASLRIGDDFEGSTIAYHKGSTTRFEIVTQAGTEKVTARAGDDPALASEAKQPGLHVVVHQSPVTTLNYTKWEKFQSFSNNKGFRDIQQRHQARGLPDKYFVEAYSRYSKSLIAVGDATGDDQHNGLEIELVALQNPYTSDVSGGMKVAGYYQGQTLPDTQIELFEKSPDGKVTISLHRTDDDGVVTLPVKPKHHYLVDMVLLRIPSKSMTKRNRAVWETVWASLTFSTD